MQTELNARQRLAAQHLAAGQTGTQVAKIVNVNPATLSGWRQQFQFQVYLAELIALTERHSLEALHGLRARAIERLGELLEANPSVALRAAIAILQATSQADGPATPLLPVADKATWSEMLTIIQTVKADETPS